jgi:CMP-N,N'-diacetyllegionaminic acid synthase
MNWIIIPARKNSKGFPNKNRYLFDFTAETIPVSLKRKTIVTTDDEEVLKKSEYYGFNSYRRPTIFCRDHTSMKEVLEDVLKNYRNTFFDEDIITVLYLTYPERKWSDIEKAYSFFQAFKLKSLLCKVDIGKNNHPFLWLLEKDNGTGEQLVEHDLYRRQDYPKMFRICHYIFMSYKKEIYNLNNNLYNKETKFFPIKEKIDVDTKEDFLTFKRSISYEK